MMRNAALAYQDSKIMTATTAELTLMLYDGMIKFCNIAIAAIEYGDITKANRNIIKAENIVAELRNTLNSSYHIAEQLENLYEYMYRRLIEANMKKDKQIIIEILDMSRELRDTWKEAMRQV